MEALKQYKYEEQNLKAAILNCNLWRIEYNKHTADMPAEIPYKERLLDKLNNAYSMLKSVEFYLDRTAFKNKYQEKFSKEKLLTEKILGL